MKVSGSRAAAVVLAGAVAMTVAACGGGSDPAPSSSPADFSQVAPAEPTATSEPTTDLTGDFPRDVPVILGKYLQSRGVTPNSYLLTVVGVQEGDYAAAKKKLADAGFDKRVEEKDKALFVGKGKVVTLAVVSNDEGLTLTYTVNDDATG